MTAFMFFRAAFCVAVLALVTSTANAFMPSTGAWTIDAESGSGAPGRGFTLEVENETVLLTYYGYRPDGTGTWYLAVGPIVNNVFKANLTEFAGGAVIGSGYRAAASLGNSPGQVSIDFSSGLKGVITFPGEGPKAVSKFGFGYGNGPSGLLGTYLFAYVTPSGNIYTSTYRLSNHLGSKTATGNGIVSDSQVKLACENQVSGVLTGVVICVETATTGNPDSYFFRMSGDRGNGVGTFKGTSLYFPLQAIRTATASGQLTGINNGTLSDVNGGTGTQSMATIQNTPDTARDSSLDYLKERESRVSKNGVVLSREEEAALNQWAVEAMAILRK